MALLFTLEPRIGLRTGGMLWLRDNVVQTAGRI